MGTVIVKITGCLVVGFLDGITSPEGRFMIPAAGRMFLMIGLCGGYTTFSSFGLDTLKLAEDRQWGWAGLNILFSVVLCLAGVWLGHWLSAGLNSQKGTGYEPSE